MYMYNETLVHVHAPEVPSFPPGGYVGLIQHHGKQHRSCPGQVAPAIPEVID